MALYKVFLAAPEHMARRPSNTEQAIHKERLLLCRWRNEHRPASTSTAVTKGMTRPPHACLHTSAQKLDSSHSSNTRITFFSKKKKPRAHQVSLTNKCFKLASNLSSRQVSPQSGCTTIGQVGNKPMATSLFCCSTSKDVSYIPTQ